MHTINTATDAYIDIVRNQCEKVSTLEATVERLETYYRNKDPDVTKANVEEYKSRYEAEFEVLRRILSFPSVNRIVVNIAGNRPVSVWLGCVQGRNSIQAIIMDYGNSNGIDKEKFREKALSVNAMLDDCNFLQISPITGDIPDEVFPITGKLGGMYEISNNDRC